MSHSEMENDFFEELKEKVDHTERNEARAAAGITDEANDAGDEAIADTADAAPDIEESEQKTAPTQAEENTPVSEPAKEEPQAAKKGKKEKASDDIAQLTAKIAELESQIKERDEKYLRMAAEYDNFRRRSKEEKDALYESAVADTVSELLPIIDNLERAALYDDGEAVKSGLVLTAKSVESVFSKMGVEPFGNVGDTFDPNIHNAVMHIDDEALGEGELVEVFQKGYRKGKRVIRFAMVKSAN